MIQKTARNAPCPCGSGKKYKNCCMRTTKVNGQEQVLSPRFRFEPGSYGGGGSDFTPSIACLEQTALDVWAHAYVLVKPSEIHGLEAPAFTEAERDLETAFGRAQRSGSEMVVGEYLSSIGYMRLDDFKVVDEHQALEEWLMDSDDLDDDELGASSVDAAILEVVETQIAEETPPETKQTYERLQAEGFSDVEAKEFIGSVIMMEVSAVLRTKAPFNEKRFVEALSRLP